jgi:O-antigen/teichoic acid export membrane protein
MPIPATASLPGTPQQLEPSSFHTIASQAMSGFGWTAVALLVSFLTKMLLTRRMPAAELGIVLATQAFIGMALAIAELGMPDAVVRYVGVEATPQSAPKRTVRIAVRIVTASALLTSALVLTGLVTWFGSIMSPAAFWTTTILTLGLPLLAVGNVIGAAYRGVNRIGTKLFMIDVARPGVVAIALLASPVVVTRNASYVAGLYVLGALVVLTALWALFRQDRQWTSSGSSTSSQLLHFGVPVAAAGLLAGPLVNGVLPAMLSGWTGSAAVAFYGIALALQGLVVLPIGILEQVVLPTWARVAARDTPSALAGSYRYYTNIGFAFAASFGILLIANDAAILTFLFGPEYAAASWALRYAVLSTLFGAMMGPNEGMLRAIGASRPIFYARLVSAVAGTAAGALLIPAYGLSGAVIAFVVTAVVLRVMYGATLYRAAGIHPFTSRHSITTVMTIAGVLAATVFADVSPIGGWAGANSLAIFVLVAAPDVRSEARRLMRSWSGDRQR